MIWSRFSRENFIKIKIKNEKLHIPILAPIKSMVACKSAPKDWVSHTMPSFLYSSCSNTNIKLLKNCWRRSLVKLIAICSKPLYSKVSKPAISKTPMKWERFNSLTSSVSLAMTTSQVKARAKAALESAWTEFLHWSKFWPLLTNSVPTLILGLVKPLISSCSSKPVINEKLIKNNMQNWLNCLAWL